MHHNPIPFLTDEEIVAFWANTTPQPNGCILWNGKRTYGTWRGLLVHRVAYAIEYDDPGALDVHHECRTKRCVNPEHLMACTRVEHGLIHGADRWETMTHGYKPRHQKRTNGNE